MSKNVEINIANNSGGYEVLYPKTDYNLLLNQPNIASKISITEGFFIGTGENSFYIILPVDWNVFLSIAYSKWEYDNGVYPQYTSVSNSYYPKIDSMTGASGLVLNMSNSYMFNLNNSYSDGCHFSCENISGKTYFKFVTNNTNTSGINVFNGQNVRYYYSVSGCKI